MNKKFDPGIEAALLQAAAALTPSFHAGKTNAEMDSARQKSAGLNDDLFIEVEKIKLRNSSLDSYLDSYQEVLSALRSRFKAGAIKLD